MSNGNNFGGQLLKPFFFIELLRLEGEPLLSMNLMPVQSCSSWSLGWLLKEDTAALNRVCAEQRLITKDYHIIFE